jgi:tight adherence protein C
MAMAGFRGPQAEVAFLFFRLVAPVLSLAISAFYTFVVAHFEFAVTIKLGIIVVATYIGLKMPELYLKNTIGKRQKSMGRAFPDAMDLLLICVESGMSIEHAFRKVAGEIGVQSIALAEELTLVTDAGNHSDQPHAYLKNESRRGFVPTFMVSSLSGRLFELRLMSEPRARLRCPGYPSYPLRLPGDRD